LLSAMLCASTLPMAVEYRLVFVTAAVYPMAGLAAVQAVTMCRWPKVALHPVRWRHPYRWERRYPSRQPRQ
jgi:hypothetical protein